MDNYRIDYTEQGQAAWLIRRMDGERIRITHEEAGDLHSWSSAEVDAFWNLQYGDMA